MSFRTFVVLACVLVASFGLYLLLLNRDAGTLAATGSLTSPAVVSVASTQATSVVQTTLPQSKSPELQVETRPSATPILAVGSDVAKDLFAFYLNAVSAGNANMVFQAAFAVSECAGMHRIRNDVQVAMAGGGGVGSLAGPFPQERADAAAEAMRRCQGFNRMSESELAQAKMAALKRAADMGSIEARYELLAGDQKPALLKRAELRSILTNPSPASVDVAARTLAFALSSTLPPELPEESRASIAGVAAMLSLCELANACSRESWGSLISCTFAARCGKGKMDDWESGLDADSRQWVRELKGKTIASVRSGNWAFLGL